VTAPRIREALRLIDLVGPDTRALSLFLLAERERTPGEIARGLGLSVHAGSWPLTILRHGELIEARREGDGLRYSLTADGVRLARLLARLAEVGESAPGPLGG
jgi:DNA-binding transcriptional ArsR family regulator